MRRDPRNNLHLDRIDGLPLIVNHVTSENEIRV